MSQIGGIFWQKSGGSDCSGAELIGPVRQNNQDVSLTVNNILAPEKARAMAAEAALQAAITGQASTFSATITAAVAAEQNRAQTAEGLAEKTANKDQPGGYAGRDSSGYVLAGALIGNGNLAGTLPAKSGMTFAIGYNYETGNGEVDFFNTYAANASGTNPAFVFWKLTSPTTVTPLAGISNQGKFTANALEIYGVGQIDSDLTVGGGVTLNANLKSTTSYVALLTSGGGLPAIEARDSGVPTVNYPFTLSGPTGSSVVYSADGSDANINVEFLAKGTGVINLASPFITKRTGGTASVDLFTACNRSFVPNDFGSVGTGNDDTAVFQAALNEINAMGGAALHVPPGTYNLSATLQGYPNTFIDGDITNKTIFHRIGDYGHTIQFGSSGSAAGSCGIRRIFFTQGTMYSAGNASLDHLVTSATSHIKIIGGQFVWLEDNFFWRMPYGITLDGTVNSYIRDNFFYQVWDPSNPALQEGVAGLWFAPSAANNQLAVVSDNYFTGCDTPTRSITYSDGATSLTTSNNGNIGAQYGILNQGCESTVYSQNYFGRQSVNCLKLAPFSTSFIVADQRSGMNFFDDCGNANGGSQIAIQASGTGVAVQDFSSIGDEFNGEFDTLNAISIVPNGTAPSAYAVTVSGATAKAHVGTPFVYTGVCGGQHEGGTITNYNSLGVAAETGSKTYNSAVYVGPQSMNFDVKNASIGGGGNSFTPVGDAANHCYFGVVIDTGATNCFQKGNANKGVKNFAPQQVPEDTVFGGAVGFFGASPIGRQTITGSRGSNTAGVLSEVISALAGIGIVTDQTTA